MTRILLIQMNFELIILSIISVIAALLLALIYNLQIDTPEDKKSFRWQMQPLIIRSILAILIGIGFISIDSYSVYRIFGTYKKDDIYLEKAANAYEHPDDTIIVNDFKRYDSIKKQESIIKIQDN